jgi:hypothetical protein
VTGRPRLHFEQIFPRFADATSKDGPTIGVAPVHTQNFYVCSISYQPLKSGELRRFKQDCCDMRIGLRAFGADDFVVSHGLDPNRFGLFIRDSAGGIAEEGPHLCLGEFYCSQ